MKDLQCMSFTSKGASEILVAGSQDTMFVIDINKGEIVKQVSTPCLSGSRKPLTPTGPY
jgi:PAB-dependent poly(A)-specific ribonuclease subunit 2